MAAVASPFGLGPAPSRGSDALEADLGRFGPDAGRCHMTVSADVGGGSNPFREVDFDPAEALIATTTSFGETVTGRLGDGPELDVPAGHGTLDAEAELPLVGDVTTAMGVIPTGFLDVEAGGGPVDASVEIDVPDRLPPRTTWASTPHHAASAPHRRAPRPRRGLEGRRPDETRRPGSDPIRAGPTIDHERLLERTWGGCTPNVGPGLRGRARRGRRHQG